MNVTSQQLCDELSRLIDTFKVFHGRAADQYNLTKVQLFALYSIGKRGEVAMGQMASVLHCDASNITGLVDRLVHQDLVVRREDTKDRRTKQLALTAKGQKIIEEVNAQLPQALGCERLNAQEQQTLYEIVQKMIGNDQPACPSITTK